jgi:hypothetical protein
MKILILILITCFCTTLSFADWKQKMDIAEESYQLKDTGSYTSLQKLNQSINEKRVIHNVLGINSWNKLYYDPVLWTMAAGVESKLDKYKQKVQWSEVKLSALTSLRRHNYYQKDLTGYFSANESSDTLFIIKGSSYSTWGSKTWAAKTSALLKDLFNPNMLAFAGLFTEEYMQSMPRFPDIAGDIMSQDVYGRIRKFVDEVNKKRSTKIKNVGLVGFSGGGAEVISLLNVDSISKFFNLGGIAFSPVLSEKVAFDNMDSIADEIVAKHGDAAQSYAGFTTFGNSFTLGVVSHFFEADVSLVRQKFDIGVPLLNDPKASLLIKKSSYETSNIEQKIDSIFFNEFVVVDLHDTIKHFNNSILDLNLYARNFEWVDTKKNGPLTVSRFRSRGNHHYLMEIFLASLAPALGSSTLRTPLEKSATISSSLTPSGRENEREKLPYLTSRLRKFSSSFSSSNFLSPETVRFPLLTSM